ncbi:galactoside-binding lectin, partial [Ostertagia ostertagi]
MHNVFYPPVPSAIPIREKLRSGCDIDVYGKVNHGSHKNFSIELLSGPHIVLHINFRFQRSDKQVRHDNPLGSDDAFQLRIHCQHNYYEIELNSKPLANFTHRFPMESVQALGMKGTSPSKKSSSPGSTSAPTGAVTTTTAMLAMVPTVWITMNLPCDSCQPSYQMAVLSDVYRLCCSSARTTLTMPTFEQPTSLAKQEYCDVRTTCSIVLNKYTFHTVVVVIRGENLVDVPLPCHIKLSRNLRR